MKQQTRRATRKHRRPAPGRELWSGCLYLSGYAVECALKACIARSTRRHDFPDKRRVNESYTHDLQTLLQAAGLRDKLDQEAQADAGLKTAWAAISNKWNVDRRYNWLVAKQEAVDLYKAAESMPFLVEIR
jgi:hypothetical protein